MTYYETASTEILTFSSTIEQKQSCISEENKSFTIAEFDKIDDYIYLYESSSDMTRNAREKARLLANKVLANETLHVLAVIRNEMAHHKTSHNFPPIYLFEPEDGSILLEWVFHDLRIGINIEQEIEESSWFLVSNESIGNINACGCLDSKVRTHVLRWLISFIISNPSLVIQ